MARVAGDHRYSGYDGGGEKSRGKVVSVVPEVVNYEWLMEKAAGGLSCTVIYKDSYFETW